MCYFQVFLSKALCSSHVCAGAPSEVPIGRLESFRWRLTRICRMQRQVTWPSSSSSNDRNTRQRLEWPQGGPKSCVGAGACFQCHACPAGSPSKRIRDTFYLHPRTLFQLSLWYVNAFRRQTKVDFVRVSSELAHIALAHSRRGETAAFIFSQNPVSNRLSSSHPMSRWWSNHV